MPAEVPAEVSVKVPDPVVPPARVMVPVKVLFALPRVQLFVPDLVTDMVPPPFMTLPLKTPFPAALPCNTRVLVVMVLLTRRSVLTVRVLLLELSINAFPVPFERKNWRLLSVSAGAPAAHVS